MFIIYSKSNQHRKIFVSTFPLNTFENIWTQAAWHLLWLSPFLVFEQIQFDHETHHAVSLRQLLIGFISHKLYITAEAGGNTRLRPLPPPYRWFSGKVLPKFFETIAKIKIKVKVRKIIFHSNPWWPSYKLTDA